MKKITFFLSAILLASVMMISTPTMAVKHIVSVSNFQFSPANVNANVGDTMRWVWSNGSHTTTSTAGAIPAGAASWDSPITSSTPIFEYKITIAGSYAYVCTPHAPNMAGTIMVTAIAPTLNVTPPNRNVTAVAGTTTFAVTSNSSWTVSSNAPWCTVSSGGSMNGTITANYAVNTTTLIRTATITVTVTGLTPQTVTVTQAASTVGLDEHAQNTFRVYPNPTKGIFNVYAGNFSDQTIGITISDMSGKNILSGVYQGAVEYTFDISQAPRGYYFVRISGENITIVKRLVLVD